MLLGQIFVNKAKHYFRILSEWFKSAKFENRKNDEILVQGTSWYISCYSVISGPLGHSEWKNSAVFQELVTLYIYCSKSVLSHVFRFLTLEFIRKILMKKNNDYFSDIPILQNFQNLKQHFDRHVQFTCLVENQSVLSLMLYLLRRFSAHLFLTKIGETSRHSDVIYCRPIRAFKNSFGRSV